MKALNYMAIGSIIGVGLLVGSCKKDIRTFETLKQQAIWNLKVLKIHLLANMSILFTLLKMALYTHTISITLK